MKDAHQRGRPGGPCAVAVLALAALLTPILPANARDDLSLATGRVDEGLRAARRSAGVAELDRLEDLDGIALERARRIAALPHDRRLSVATSVENEMRDAGITDFRDVVEHVDLWAGRSGPGKAFLSSWRRYDQAWGKAMSPAYDSVGLGAAEASDGWVVFVAVLARKIEPVEPVDVRKLERATFEAVNRARKEHGLRPLRSNADLAVVAASHSEDMARLGYFDHRSPAGTEPADRVRATGTAFVKLGENLQKNNDGGDPVGFAVRSWMRSREHRETMLDPDYRETGVGIRVDDDGTIFFTQLFLVPRYRRN